MAVMSQEQDGQAKLTLRSGQRLLVGRRDDAVVADGAQKPHP